MPKHAPPNRDPKVDAYIEQAQPFARPILRQIRETVHGHAKKCGGSAIGEAIKWGMPMFTYKGANLCHMAAFKAHASFGFWRREGETKREMGDDAPEGMGMFGKLGSADDLPPPETIAALMDANMALIDSGAKTPRPAPSATPRPLNTETPPTLAAALAANGPAKATYDALPPGEKRNYDEWITEAKRKETRDKRLAQAVEWLAEGKRRYWKYEKC